MPQIINLDIKKNVATTCYIALQSQTGVVAYQANPTLAAGDVKHTGDGSALANLGTLPAVEPAGSRNVKVTISQAEANYNLIAIIFADAAGAEWHDTIINIRTFDVDIEDLVRSTTPANALNVDASGRIDVGKWLGQAVTTSATSLKPMVDVSSISDDSTAADNIEAAHDGTGYAGGTILQNVNVSKISDDSTAADNCEAMFDGAGYAGGSIKLGVDAVAISGDSVAADNLEAAYDGAGYAGGTIKQEVDCVKVNGSATAGANMALMFNGTGYAGGTTPLNVNVQKISDDATAADNLELAYDGTGYAGGTILPRVDAAAISGDTVAADNAEKAFDGTGYDFAACSIPTVVAITNQVSLNLSQAISEGQTARTVGGTLEAPEAAQRNKATSTGNGGTDTLYRSDGTTPLIARSRTLVGSTQTLQP